MKNLEDIDTPQSATRQRLTAMLTKAELQEVTQRSNLAGVWAIASIWAVIVALFAFSA